MPRHTAAAAYSSSSARRYRPCQGLCLSQRVQLLRAATAPRQTGFLQPPTAPQQPQPEYQEGSQNARCHGQAMPPTASTAAGCGLGRQAPRASVHKPGARHQHPERATAVCGRGGHPLPAWWRRSSHYSRQQPTHVAVQSLTLGSSCLTLTTYTHNTAPSRWACSSEDNLLSDGSGSLNPDEEVRWRLQQSQWRRTQRSAASWLRHLRRKSG